MTIDFDEFEEVELLNHSNIVYVIFYTKDSITPVPFYVGETSRPYGRIADYLSAQFSASTDFKVGEAVKYLQELGFPVVLKFRKSDSRKYEEKLILDSLRCKFLLLNDLQGYDYTIADKGIERKKVQEFINQITTKNRIE